MKKVIVKKAMDALKKQALKEQDLNEIKGGKFIEPPFIAGMFPIDPPLTF